MKVKSVIAGIAAMLGFAAVQAAPIALQPGPVYIQFNNLEQAGAIDTSGFSNINLGSVNGEARSLSTNQVENNWGVFNVSSIQAGGVATPNLDISGGTPYFADTLSGGQVHGIFYGLQFSSATTLVGGYMDIYWTDNSANNITNAEMNGGFSPTNRTDWNQAGKFTAGQLMVRIAFQTGIISGSSTTISSNQNPLNVLQTGQADGFGSVMDVNGDGLINAADGAWASTINADWFHVDADGDGISGEAGETRDLRFTTLFNNLDSWDGANGIQGLRSNDPARAFAIPEPTSLALVGLSLLGLGLARRRKQ